MTPDLILIESDDILCEWCRTPVTAHPQDRNGTFRCFDARARPTGRFPNVKNYRWSSSDETSGGMSGESIRSPGARVGPPQRSSSYLPPSPGDSF